MPTPKASQAMLAKSLRNALFALALFSAARAADGRMLLKSPSNPHRGSYSCAIVAPKAFNNLPLGAVKPFGWLQNQVLILYVIRLDFEVDTSYQLALQTDGLAGHEHEFYN